MKICIKCGAIMITGTHYEGRRHNRYSECPICHERINGKTDDNGKIKDERNT